MLYCGFNLQLANNNLDNFSCVYFLFHFYLYVFLDVSLHISYADF